MGLFLSNYRDTKKWNPLVSLNYIRGSHFLAQPCISNRLRFFRSAGTRALFVPGTHWFFGMVSPAWYLATVLPVFENLHPKNKHMFHKVLVVASRYLQWQYTAALPVLAIKESDLNNNNTNNLVW